jgi:SSS family solute:Na+ symporter
MSGMAGNVSAFSTVWTYDIYKPLIKKDGSDSHYVSVGRWATVLGIVVSIGTAYLVMQAAGIMDYVQALFSFFIAPLLGTVLAGMFWKRATKAGGFWGLLVGTVTSVALYAWVRVEPSALRYVAFSPDAKAMAADLYRALWAFSSKPKPLSELAGLVYGASELPQQEPVPLLKNQWFWAAIVITVFFIVNIVFY